MRELLHSEPGLEIFFVAEEGELSVEIVSTPDDGPDLAVQDEVVVVVNGEPRKVDATSSQFARAALGPEDDYVHRPFELMVRVFEFFEGWEFEA